MKKPKLMCVRKMRACVHSCECRCGQERSNHKHLSRRQVICVLRFPVVTPAVVTMLMKSTQRHRRVSTLA
ncbi:hypothetical protein BC827DRAFT_655744 [Russula dissimulans]|nr:hypothetical protein BC827DRAFT_655744 [Russula dissimulans]